MVHGARQLACVQHTKLQVSWPRSPAARSVLVNEAMKVYVIHYIPVLDTTNDEEEVDLFLFKSMLNWRPFFRPASIARRATQGQRRSIHATIPRALEIQPRPSGVLAKLRFRADGRPRSRWMGAFVGTFAPFPRNFMAPGSLIALAIGTLLFTNILTMASMFDLIEESENALGVLAGVVYMHKLDLEYSTVNLDDPVGTYMYFRRMYQAFSQLSDEEMDPLFKHFNRLVLSSDESDAELQERLHEITRQVAEEIHATLRDIDSDSILNLANHILLVMKDALESMLELIQDVEDADSDGKYSFQLIKARTRKDPGTSAKDYEVLG